MIKETIARLTPINSTEIWYCPRCGKKLKVVSKKDEDWGEFCDGYRQDHGTEWYLCTNKKCIYSEIPMVVHHPAYGWDHPSGDSWAIGYIK